MTSPDPSRVIASLTRNHVRKTMDFRFLAGLYMRADGAALASFEEHVLVDTFEQVCDAVDPAAENPRKAGSEKLLRSCTAFDGGFAVAGGLIPAAVRVSEPAFT